MRLQDQSFSDEQLAEIRNSWEQTLTIENAVIFRDHFASQSQYLMHERVSDQPERAPICNYWEDCYDPVGDYASIGGGFFLGLRLIVDQWGNVYLNGFGASTPGAGVVVGNINIYEDGGLKNIEDLAPDQQELVAQRFLTGPYRNVCLSGGLTACGSSPLGTRNVAIEGGWTTPGISFERGTTILIHDSGGPSLVSRLSNLLRELR